MNLFRAQLRARKRRPGESLQSVYLDVSRLAALAFPGVPTEHAEAVAVDAFIDALGDESLELRVRDREPADLDTAYRTALVMEANSRPKLTEDGDGYGRKERQHTRVRATEQARNEVLVVEQSANNVAVDAARLDKLETMMHQLLKNAKKETSVAPELPEKRHESQAEGAVKNRRPLVCFNCGEEGHMSRACPTKNQRGEERRTEYRRQDAQNQSRRDDGPKCFGCGRYEFRQGLSESTRFQQQPKCTTPERRPDQSAKLWFVRRIRGIS